MGGILRQWGEKKTRGEGLGRGSEIKKQIFRGMKKASPFHRKKSLVGRGMTPVSTG